MGFVFISSAQINIDECSTHDCQNGAMCMMKSTGYSCICGNDTYGSHCQLLKNPCDNNPCRNGGLCNIDGVNEFNCTCPSGFEGIICDVNIDDCVEHQCAIGSTCDDEV